MSGRPPDLDGTESIIGLFINTVPTRLTVPGSQRVISWLHDLQVQQAESRRFDFVPLSQLRAWCDLPGGTSLFDSIVVFENYPFDRDTIAAHGLEMREICDFQSTNYPLSVIIVPGHQLSVMLDYDPALFDTVTVERMAGHLQVLLAAIAADPGQLVGGIELATPAERARVLAAAAGPVRDVPGRHVPRAVPGTGGPHPRRDRAGRRPGPAQLRPPQHPRQPAGPPPHRRRRRPRAPHRAGPAPHRRHDHRHPGRPQNRRRLPARRPRPAPRPHQRPARRRPARPHHHHRHRTATRRRRRARRGSSSTTPAPPPRSPATPAPTWPAPTWPAPWTRPAPPTSSTPPAPPEPPRASSPPTTPWPASTPPSTRTSSPPPPPRCARH